MEFSNEAIGARIIETVTDGLYSGNLNAIREYIQNSIDSGAKRIDIRFENGNNDIIISDDGKGMNKSELEKSVEFGKSSKEGDEIGWRGIGIYSGVSASERLVIITKKQNSPKLRLEMDNLMLGSARRSTTSALEVLSKAISDVEEMELGRDASEKKAHFTQIRLENILDSQKGIFTPQSIKEYISKVAPISFNYEKYPGLQNINEWLISNGIKFPKIQIFFENELLFRPPYDSEKYYSYPIYHIFERNGKKIAAAWFLTNKDNIQMNWPNGGIFFKKKGMTIGDETLIRQYYTGQYNVWQFGEIHIISPDLFENASRNGFEYNSEFTDFLKQIQKLIRDIQGANRYKSATIKTKKIAQIKKSIDEGEIGKAKEILGDLEKSRQTIRSFPEEPSLQTIKKTLDSQAEELDDEVAELKSEIKDFEESSEKAEIQRAKDEIRKTIQNLPKPVQKSMKRFKGDGLLEPVITVADAIEDLLKKKTGDNPDKFIDLTQNAYGWSNVSARGDPKLWIHYIEEKNRRFGVMVYSFYDLIINEFKHEKGKEVLKWLEDVPEVERYKVTNEIIASMGLLYRLIDHSSTQKPTQKK